MAQATQEPTMKSVKGASPNGDGAEGDSGLSGWKPDDDQLALKLAPQLQGKLAFFHSGWHRYDGGVWNTRDTFEVRRYIRGELRTMRLAGADIRVSQTRIKALASMLEDDLFIPDRAIIAVQDEQKRYVNLRNGLFNLDTMRFEAQHDPKLYFTSQLAFDYNEDATCPTFRRFLESSLVLPEGDSPDGSLITLVLEALAYSMTARTDLKSSFWLVGKKDSGKSTFISVLKNIMGSLHATIDLTQLGINRFLLSGIVGKRVITFTEASGSSVLPDALYKALTGGSDEIYADVKNRDPICFRPEAKVWWAMNDMPRMTDRSGATARRLIIIPFNRTIPERQRILDLEQRLMKERSGIFNEMVIFYQRLQRAGGFEYCEQSEALRQQYISENDTEASFAEECLERHESYRVATRELYNTYRDWCESYGFKPKNHNQLAGEWRRLGFVDIKSGGNTVWKGARIREKTKI